MARNRVFRAFRVLFDQPRRTFDVGKQEGHGAAGEALHARERRSGVAVKTAGAAAPACGDFNRNGRATQSRMARGMVES
jgi:hypothetical protein